MPPASLLRLEPIFSTIAIASDQQDLDDAIKRLWSGLRVNSLDCVSSSLCKHNPLQRTRVIVNEAWPERVLLKLSTWWLQHENHETLFGGKFKVLQSGRSIFGSGPKNGRQTVLSKFFPADSSFIFDAF